MNYLKKTLSVFLQFFLVLTCRSQPEFQNSFNLHEVLFYRDHKAPGTFYYLPAGLELNKKTDGSPDFNFIMMRYTGSALYDIADAQTIRHLNQLTMKINVRQPHPDSLQMAKQGLTIKYNAVQIRPLPLSNIEAMLVYTPINPASNQDTFFVKKGELALETGNDTEVSGNYWNEKYFTIFPDDYSAMLLHDAWKKQSAAISFTYVLYAKGLSDYSVLENSGFGSLAEKIKTAAGKLNRDTAKVKECIVATNSWSVTIDLTRYPGIIKTLDINDAIPKGYAIINIRNYDFTNRIRTDLYEKTVELQATGAGGDPVSCYVTFSAAKADISSFNYRFRYAIRPEFPYRYRVIELFQDGHEETSSWRTISAWSGLLDVTTNPSYNQTH